MGGETWPLIGLKHSVCKSVLRGQIEVRLNCPGRVVHIGELRICSRLATGLRRDSHPAGSIHGAIVIRVLKIDVTVPKVVATNKTHRTEGHGHMIVGYAAGRNIDPWLEAGIAAKQVVWTTIFLNDHDDVIESYLRARRCECK